MRMPRFLISATLVFFYATVAAAQNAPPLGARIDRGADRRFPACDAVVDVTRPPYHARGDGKADDTDALQRALSDAMGQHKILYLPKGTYLVSRTLVWSKKNSAGLDAWGFTWVQGQNPVDTVLRLKDGVFPDPGKPQAVLQGGGFGSADWFHNYVQDLTIDVGRGNPGAIGLQFYSNNTGAVRNVRIVDAQGAGAVGLDLGYRDMNGPLLVKDLEVRGFEEGIRTGGVVNSQTFEHITLEGQRKVGLANLGQSISIRGLESRSAVAAVRALSPTALVDARLEGQAGPAQPAAVEVGKNAFFARGVATSGYSTAVRGIQGADVRVGSLAAFLQGATVNPSGGPLRSLSLPVEETPDVPWDDPATWAIVDRFGADPTSQRDASDAIQKAIDSGATTVFFPGAYLVLKPVTVRGKVRRLLGTGQPIDYFHRTKPDLIVADGDAPLVVVEHFAPINGGVVVDTKRTVVFRSVETTFTMKQPARVFLEDVATGDLRLLPGQKIWARQLDVENQGTHVSNPGGVLWVLGYKTERGGTLLETTAGGSSEVLGNFSYTTTAGKLAPMFVTEGANSQVFAFFNEVCYSGDPFQTLVREERAGKRQTVPRGNEGLNAYVAIPVSKP